MGPDNATIVRYFSEQETEELSADQCDIDHISRACVPEKQYYSWSNHEDFVQSTDRLVKTGTTF